MTPETSALYRQVALALEAKSVTGLMDECQFAKHHLACSICAPCHFCSGTGVVVPSEAECFWRLVTAWNIHEAHRQGCPQDFDLLGNWLRATAAALGIEAQEEAT